MNSDVFLSQVFSGDGSKENFCYTGRVMNAGFYVLSAEILRQKMQSSKDTEPFLADGWLSTFWKSFVHSDTAVPIVAT
jgi:hypothetical protein